MERDTTTYMRRLIQELVFDDELEKKLNWDCIVISASDKEQKKCFELQLQEKIFSNHIPNLKYMVVADPPGNVIGSGGSTMYILSELMEIYGSQEELCSKRILLIHAGGFSKRLPSLSCTGKLFCPLPIEAKNGKLICLLYLKLIMTYPFLKFMKTGGVFITCSDDLEAFSLEGIDDALNSTVDGNGVIAIAHPSSIAIGETHGVYAMPSNGKNNKSLNTCWTSLCLEVLQKPSSVEMESHGAILNSSDGEEPVVYTDSMFWCGPNLVKSMVQFAEENKDELYKTETCIYGDFLASMGTCKPEEKLFWKKTSADASINMKMATHFQNSPLSILILEKSKFFHLGTMPEYLENLCQSSELYRVLGMKPVVHCRTGASLTCRGIITDSVIQSAVEISQGSTVDNCIFHTPLVVEPCVILSNCVINDPDIKIIPSGWLFHSSAIKKDGKYSYVTIAFRIDENLKTCVEHSWKHLAEGGSSLWTARLFEARTSMSDSFSTTWRSVTRSIQCQHKDDDIVRFSMIDIVKLKHVEGFLQHRNSINNSFHHF